MTQLSGLNSPAGSESRFSQSPDSNSSSNSKINPFETVLQEFPETMKISAPNTQNITEPDVLTIHSMALSEANTYFLQRDYPRRLCLPQTYQENFHSYAPSFVRRFYGERTYNGYAENIDNATNLAANAGSGDYHDYDDDDMTMISQKDGLFIMGRETTDYGHLRTLVVASDIIKNNMYVFPDSESFEMFRNIRSGRTNQRKISGILLKSEAILQSGEERQIRAGLLPFDSILRNVDGIQQCLPVLKVKVPFLSSIRPKTPFMIFRQYSKTQSYNNTSADSDSDSELVHVRDFCSVNLKSFQDYKRYTFVFQPEDGEGFTVLAFQHNYRPFADFNYKETRFRVFGTSRTVSYPTFYNPELKVQVLDSNQPSLMDDLICKKSKRDYFKKERHMMEVFAGQEIQNPVPSPENPILKQLKDEEYSSFYRNSVPREMPPFGKFLDACAYVKKKPLIPKKFSETGKIAVYEDSLEFNSSLNSAYNLDSLVLTSVFLALRENSIRSTVKRDEIEIF